MNTLEIFNRWLSQLSPEDINNLTDDEVMAHAMERPGHPGQLGFMFKIDYFRSSEHFAEASFAIMQRLSKSKQTKNI